MSTQNLLDANGNLIGTIDLPDSMSQDEINGHLALYTYTAPPVTSLQYVSSAINEAAAFGQGLIVQYAASNVLQGITQAGKTQVVADYLADISYYLRIGSLYAAMNNINTMIADTSDAKTAVAPYITNDLLYQYLNYIQTYLLIPLTPNPGN